MGVPLFIIHLKGNSYYKPSSYWGTPMTMPASICIRFQQLQRRGWDQVSQMRSVCVQPETIPFSRGILDVLWLYDFTLCILGVAATSSYIFNSILCDRMIYDLTFYLTFYLTYSRTFYLAFLSDYILTFYLALLADIFSDIASGTLSGHSIWHLIWHVFRHTI